MTGCAYTLGELGAVEATLRRLGGVSVRAAPPGTGARSRRGMELLTSFRERRACAMEGIAGGGRSASWALAAVAGWRRASSLGWDVMEAMSGDWAARLPLITASFARADCFA